MSIGRSAYTLFTDSFETSYREEMEDLFGKLRAQDTNGAQVLDEYSDYRNYLDYDIEIKEGEKIIRFSSVGAESSGGTAEEPVAGGGKQLRHDRGAGRGRPECFAR